MREYEHEPIPGLPEHLPPGEAMLWQGAPRWTALALRAFHIRKVAIYFAAILALHIAWNWTEAPTLAGALLGATWILVLALLAIGALSWLAWAMARSTIYTITSKRVMMRFGVALPMIVNFPFAQIRSADLRVHPDGTGDLPLLLADGVRISWLVQWPHVRPWRFAPVEPMLRAIPDAQQVAGILGGALQTYTAARAAELAEAGAASDAGAPSDRTESAGYAARS